MCRILTRIRRSIMIVSRRLILCCLFLLTVATQPAHALDPTRRIAQYGHTAWRIQDGFLGASPKAIAQTADGYLWIGTEAGLVRFDGVRFRSVDAAKRSGVAVSQYLFASRRA